MVTKPHPVLAYLVTRSLNAKAYTKQIKPGLIEVRNDLFLKQQVQVLKMLHLSISQVTILYEVYGVFLLTWQLECLINHG